MTTYAIDLIRAVQSCSPETLKAEVRRLKSIAEAEVEHLPIASDRAWARQNYVNDKMNGSMGLTALHVAAKAYSAHHQDLHLAKVFNEMVQILLDAHASPFIEVGAIYSGTGQRRYVQEKGKTAAQVCGRHIPPALAAFLSGRADEDYRPRGFALPEYHEQAKEGRLAKASLLRHQRAEIAERLAQREA